MFTYVPALDSGFAGEEIKISVNRNPPQGVGYPMIKLNKDCITIMTNDNEQDHQYPIDGTLDLHHFAPKDTKEVLLEYIRICLEKEIYTLRIVHGKGIWVKRDIVQAILKEHNAVKEFHQEGGSGGSWGATIVTLHRE